MIKTDFIYNGKKIGEFVRMPGDGEWAFKPELSGGLWTAYMLRKIANQINKQNERNDSTT